MPPLSDIMLHPYLRLKLFSDYKFQLVVNVHIQRPSTGKTDTSTKTDGNEERFNEVIKNNKESMEDDLTEFSKPSTKPERMKRLPTSSPISNTNKEALPN